MEPRNQGSKAALAEEAKAFDLNEPAYKNNTFGFTREELEAIEDAKLELQRKYDLPATKNDIVRCGIHTVIDDHRRRGEDSILVKAMKRKKPR